MREASFLNKIRSVEIGANFLRYDNEEHWKYARNRLDNDETDFDNWDSHEFIIEIGAAKFKYCPTQSTLSYTSTLVLTAWYFFNSRL